MITVIKNGEVFAPSYLGKKDVVIAGGKIEAIADNLIIPKDSLKFKVIDAEGKFILPGFVDSHVHIIGGGGEGGFKNRTPEIQLSQITLSGITTVVGCLGTDGVCRDMKTLLAKARALEEEGISTYIYTGSYEIPVKTITGEVRSDIMLIDKIIGAGEIALSDNRSSEPTFEEFVHVVAEARVGGMLSGKAGIVNIHMGNGKKKLEYLIEMVNKTDIPITQVIPTHLGRSLRLFKSAVEFAKLGGIVDLTTSSEPDLLKDDEIKASGGLKMLLEMGIPIEQIQFSSDGQGSIPVFNDRKQLVGLGIGSTKTLFREVRDAVINDGIEFEDAIKVITSNVADHLKFNNKGRIEEGKDGDIVIVDNDSLDIEGVIAKGREMVVEGKAIVKGTFE